LLIISGVGTEFVK